MRIGELVILRWPRNRRIASHASSTYQGSRCSPTNRIDYSLQLRRRAAGRERRDSCHESRHLRPGDSMMYLGIDTVLRTSCVEATASRIARHPITGEGTRPDRDARPYLRMRFRRVPDAGERARLPASPVELPRRAPAARWPKRPAASPEVRDQVDSIPAPTIILTSKLSWTASRQARLPSTLS